MADNTELNAGTGGDVIASDDIAGVKHQRVKISVGADGAATDALGGAGAVAAGVLRVTLASDDPAVAALQILDNAIAGNEIQADIVAALPAGTNNIGDVDILTIAAGDNNIGNVDVVTLPNVTNAGTFAVQVDGAALTALQLIDDTVAVLGTDTYTETTSKGLVIGAVRRDADTTLVGTTNEVSPLQVDANGRLKVEAFSGETLPVSLATVPSHAVTNAGTFAVQADSVIPGTGATNLGKAEDAAHTTGDVGVMMLGVRAAAPTERSAGPTDGDYVPLGVNEVGAQWGTLTPSANGGTTTFMASGSDGSSILVATAQVIKATAGVLYGYYAYNPEAAVTFVHFYNTAAASVTVGTTNPMFTIAIPAASAANLALPYGITFSNAGWSCAATTTAGGNTAPATGVSLVAWYK